ncbi:MAG: hypothetical protein IPP77_01005 [Bacteroidetes bacterium]|nr:hypothetical protein [Bacteroidota bacterium]
MEQIFFVVTPQVVIYEEDAKIIAMSIFAMPDEMVGDFISKKPKAGKKLRLAVRNKLGIKTTPMLSYEALHMGFDKEGCFRGQPLFNARECKRLCEMAPWLHEIKVKPEPDLEPKSEL